jgi:hypothetical protein
MSAVSGAREVRVEPPVILSIQARFASGVAADGGGGLDRTTPRRFAQAIMSRGGAGFFRSERRLYFRGGATF